MTLERLLARLQMISDYLTNVDAKNKVARAFLETCQGEIDDVIAKLKSDGIREAKSA